MKVALFQLFTVLTLFVLVPAAQAENADCPSGNCGGDEQGTVEEGPAVGEDGKEGQDHDGDGDGDGGDDDGDDGDDGDDDCDLTLLLKRIEETNDPQEKDELKGELCHCLPHRVEILAEECDIDGLMVLYYLVEYTDLFEFCDKDKLLNQIKLAICNCGQQGYKGSCDYTPFCNANAGAPDCECLAQLAQRAADNCNFRLLRQIWYLALVAGDEIGCDPEIFPNIIRAYICNCASRDPEGFSQVFNAEEQRFFCPEKTDEAPKTDDKTPHSSGRM